MQVIIPTTSLVEQIVGRQKRTDGQRYRLMTYVVQQPIDDGVLLYNTLTCSLVLLTPDEAADITAQQKLIDRWFLVPQEHDDQKLCRQVRQMATLLKPTAKAITGYTILTTTGCNARCFYCYEKGTKPVTMTAETADKVVRHIVKHRGDEKVSLKWFGGEPLVNARVIDQICTELCEQGVPFRSKMISNGYLFDADMVQRAKDLWQLRSVQITLDGTEQTYNRVKAYVHQGVNAFERVLQNIAMLTAAGIRVFIRLNVDKHNIGEMNELVELLHQRFGTNEHLSIYSHELFGERTPEDEVEIFAQQTQLAQQIAACGYKNHKRGLQKDIKLNHCMADNDGGVVIAPDGHLGKCEHYTDREFFGHIGSEERDETVIRKFKERPADIDACATCFYYPQCIRLTMCEPEPTICTPGRQQYHLSEMRDTMKYEYERYLRKNDKEQEDETEI
ncbi:MAG: radical SAM protein [Bacteroidaceae bacterium]|nr:radical SAM protein [Bacteroidaceae bacterium]